MRLRGKRVIVTGGAQGIGKGIVSRFLQEGARVAVIDHNEKELQASLKLWKSAGYEAVAHGCDLRDKARLAEVVESIFLEWEAVDILVNNAGIAIRESLFDITIEKWEAIFDVNLNAMFFLSQQIARKMVEKEIKGSIVNMSSKNGLGGSANLAHYNASKAGVNLLTQSMAVELAAYGIRVNAVAPGLIDTPLDRELKKLDPSIAALSTKIPMGRLGTTDEVANAFLFLASDEASFITGTTLVVDGGHLANASEN